MLDLISVIVKLQSLTSFSFYDMAYIPLHLIAPRLLRLSQFLSTSSFWILSRKHPCLSFIIRWCGSLTTQVFPNPRYVIRCIPTWGKSFMQPIPGSISFIYGHGSRVPSPEDAQTCHEGIWSRWCHGNKAWGMCSFVPCMPSAWLKSGGRLGTTASWTKVHRNQFFYPHAKTHLTTDILIASSLQLMQTFVWSAKTCQVNQQILALAMDGLTSFRKQTTKHIFNFSVTWFLRRYAYIPLESGDTHDSYPAQYMFQPPRC